MRSFVAIDFETADTNRHSPCAIGMVKVIDGVIIQRIFSLIRPPENEYSIHNIRVHGIKPEHSEYAPEFIDFYPIIKKTINYTNVVCHNASFDIDVLQKTMAYHGINHNELEISIFDTLDIFKKPLDQCCSDCGIELNHHDCLSDAEACAKLFMKYNDITPKEFKTRVPGNKFGKIEFHKQFDGDILKQDLSSVTNPDNPFYNKKVVITGTYINWPDRTELGKLIKSLGADIDKKVNKNTQILIAGANAGPGKLADMAYNIFQDPSRTILNEEKLINILNSLTPER